MKSYYKKSITLLPKKIRMPVLILLLQNTTIFFADIVQSMMGIQFICLCLYIIYLILNKKSLRLFPNLSVWSIYIGIVAINYIIGGDRNFIAAFLICNICMFIMLQIPDLVFYEIKIIKVFSCIHLLSSLVVYIFPHIYIDSLFRRLLRSNANANYSWRVISNLNAGITTQPGLNAIFLAILMMVCAVELIETNKNRIWNIILFVASFVMVFSTGKRSVLFMIIPVIVLYYILIHYNRIKRITTRRFQKFLILIIGVFLGGYWILNVSGAVRIILDKIMYLSSIKDISNGRFEIWSIAWDMFLSNPILGIGFKSIYAIHGIDVHNTYLQILTESGVIGFTVFIIGLMYILKSSRVNVIKANICKDRKFIKVSGFGYMLILFLVLYGLVGNTFIDYTPVMLFCMSLVMTLFKKGEYSSDKHNNTRV